MVLMTEAEDAINGVLPLVEFEVVAIEMLTENALRSVGKEKTELSDFCLHVAVVVVSQFNLLYWSHFVLASHNCRAKCNGPPMILNVVC